MTEDKPEHAHGHKATAALDEFMATVLRHLRMGEGNPLEELGLQKSSEELEYWRPDVPGSGAQEQESVSKYEAADPG